MVEFFNRWNNVRNFNKWWSVYCFTFKYYNAEWDYRFDEPENHMMAALAEYVSWGYFDPGASNYADGYQCPPVNWGIGTERKRQFFKKLSAISGQLSAKDSAARGLAER